MWETEGKKEELSFKEKSELLTIEKITEKSFAAKEAIHRIPTGITTLDKLLEGGFIPNAAILISGEAGTGKTIFCSQFIWNALCTGENGVYITLQQSVEDIKNDLEMFGRDFVKAEQIGQCRFVYIEPQDIRKIVQKILKNVKEINAKRLVIDSITLIGEYADKSKDIRYNLIYLVKELKRMGVTTLMVSEVDERSDGISRFGIEEFIADGVVILKCGVDVVGGRPRSLIIKKMRRTKHDLNTHSFEITERGIKIIE